MSGNEKIKVEFNARPDGYGFIYGKAKRGDEIIDVNVIPPKAEWDGDMVLKGYEPEDGNYQVLVEGEVVARVEKREDIGQAVFPAIEK
jgi:hypothetical protein